MECMRGKSSWQFAVAGCQLMLVILLCVSPLIGYTQTNLIPDPGFEDVNVPPFVYDEYFTGRSKQWFSPIQGIPAIYSTVIPKSDSVYNPTRYNPTRIFGRKEEVLNKYDYKDISPLTYYGFQYPKSGTNFAGLSAYKPSTQSYDYIGIKLTQELQKGQHYCFTMHLSLADLSKYYGFSLGCVFLSQQDVFTYRSNNYPSLPDYKLSILKTEINLKSDFLFDLKGFTDTTNWVPFSDTYTAKGDEIYLIIGAFEHHSPAVRNFKTTNSKSVPISRASGYYFIDDVSLVLQADSGKCAPPSISIESKKPSLDSIFTIPNLNFDTDDWVIKPEAYPTLDSLRNLLLNMRGIGIEVTGYIYDTANTKRNQALAENRARAVVEYLIRKGIKTSVISYKGSVAVPAGLANHVELRFKKK